VYGSPYLFFGSKSPTIEHMKKAKMPILACPCGYKASDPSHYKVEARMWHHAIHKHARDMRKMSANAMAKWLRGADRKMGVR